MSDVAFDGAMRGGVGGYRNAEIAADVERFAVACGHQHRGRRAHAGLLARSACRRAAERPHRDDPRQQLEPGADGGRRDGPAWPDGDRLERFSNGVEHAVTRKNAENKDSGEPDLIQSDRKTLQCPDGAWERALFD